jgi:hypothetical protein
LFFPFLILIKEFLKKKPTLKRKKVNLIQIADFLKEQKLYDTFIKFLKAYYEEQFGNKSLKSMLTDASTDNCSPRVSVIIKIPEYIHFLDEEKNKNVNEEVLEKLNNLKENNKLLAKKDTIKKNNTKNKNQFNKFKQKQTKILDNNASKNKKYNKFIFATKQVNDDAKENLLNKQMSKTNNVFSDVFSKIDLSDKTKSDGNKTGGKSPSPLIKNKNNDILNNEPVINLQQEICKNFYIIII